jgi:hypothetical protein
MLTNYEKRLIGLSIILIGVLSVFAHAQDKPGKGIGGPSRLPSARPSIPMIRVKGRPVMADFPGFTGGRGVGSKVGSPPAALPPDKRVSMLRESGIDVRPESAPREFRLSPRGPYVSSSAYLFFKGETEFNASGDSLLISIAAPVPVPRVNIPGLGDWNWASGGPQPDPPGFVGVLVRMDPRSRYLIDFSVSSDVANVYGMTVTGAEGSGTFSHEAGGKHVLVGLESADGGYVRINFSAQSSFTFHNVVVTKLD